MMNAGERGRQRIWTEPSSPNIPAPEPVSPSSTLFLNRNHKVPTGRVRSLPNPRKRGNKQIVDNSDDEEGYESDVVVSQNLRKRQRRRNEVRGDKASKKSRSMEDLKPTRLTRAAAKVKHH